MLNVRPCYSCHSECLYILFEAHIRGLHDRSLVITVSFVPNPNAGEANKLIADYKYKLTKCEQEIASLQASLARSETQVIRYKSTADAAEKIESELKIERRKLQREVCHTEQTRLVYMHQGNEKKKHFLRGILGIEAHENTHNKK